MLLLFVSAAQHFHDGVFTQRIFALDFQAVVPFPGKIALQIDIDGGRDDHCQQGPERGNEHVFLCVPDITLGTKISYAQIASHSFGCTPLE